MINTHGTHPPRKFQLRAAPSEFRPQSSPPSPALPSAKKQRSGRKKSRGGRENKTRYLQREDPSRRLPPSLPQETSVERKGTDRCCTSLDGVPRGTTRPRNSDISATSLRGVSHAILNFGENRLILYDDSRRTGATGGGNTNVLARKLIESTPHGLIDFSRNDRRLCLLVSKIPATESLN